jgi:hypothetical protein
MSKAITPIYDSGKIYYLQIGTIIYENGEIITFNTLQDEEEPAIIQEKGDENGTTESKKDNHER